MSCARVNSIRTIKIPACKYIQDYFDVSLEIVSELLRCKFVYSFEDVKVEYEYIVSGLL